MIVWQKHLILLNRFATQEVMHVRIRQVREGPNREAVSISGDLPSTWNGSIAPTRLDPALENLMKASVVTYMSATFGVLILIQHVLLSFLCFTTGRNRMDTKPKYDVGMSTSRRHVRTWRPVGQHFYS